MERTSARFLAEACGGALMGASGLYAEGVKIDSRECKPGDLFVAVVGEINDGHRFMEGAYGLGARIFLVSDEDAANALISKHKDACCILTENTDRAFSEMAMAYIRQFNPIKIGITGSTGKTSTKALTKAVFSAKYNTVCSERNYNTHLGICMTCFLADKDTQAIIFEMGMDRVDELYENTAWLRPDTVAITNVGVVHMENIGTREGVAVEKLKITSHLEPDAYLVYNCDSPFLNRADIVRLSSGSFNMLAAGEGPEAQLSIRNVRNEGDSGIAFELDLKDKKDGIGESPQHAEFSLPFLGLHNAHNGAIAAGLGLIYGISLKEAAETMPDAEIEHKRMDVYKGRGITLIDSSYNANPDSMASAVKTLAGYSGKRRIAVISDMRELGSASDDSHLDIGKLCADEGIDILAAIGDNRELYVKGAGMGTNPVGTLCFENTDSALESVPGMLKEGDTVLVKGSLSTEIFRLADKIKEAITE